jgi:galactonate dehydratase
MIHARGTHVLGLGLEEMLLGQDPLNVEFLWERIRTMGIFAGAQAGQYVTALTGVEIALWDLAGKALGLPVYQLLGGKMRDRIRLYCDSETRIRTIRWKWPLSSPFFQIRFRDLL